MKEYSDKKQEPVNKDQGMPGPQREIHGAGWGRGESDEEKEAKEYNEAIYKHPETIERLRMSEALTRKERKEMGYRNRKMKSDIPIYYGKNKPEEVSEVEEDTEEEAEDVSEKVTRMKEADAVKTSPLTPLLKGEGDEASQGETISAKRAGSDEMSVRGETADKIKNLSGGTSAGLSTGQPLSSEERDYFEPRFGADFSGVRVHTGPDAERMSAAINAKAFTVGNTIVYGKGQYQPHTIEGKKLAAHELTHVVQQGGALPMRKARHWGVLRNGFVRVASVSSNTIQRYDSYEHLTIGDQAQEKAALGTYTVTAKGGLWFNKDYNEKALKKGNSPVTEKAPVPGKRTANGSFVIAEGTVVQVVDVMDSKWVKVQHNSETGYMYRAYLKKVDKSSKPDTIKIGDIHISLGMINALGDFYASYEDILKADPVELKELINLINDQKNDPKDFYAKGKDKKFDKITDKRYIKLAEKNSPHFGTDPTLVPGGKGKGKTSLSNWKTLHTRALQLMLAAGKERDESKRTMLKEKARGLNAFADHFLSDVFTLGHLFNKDDLMALVKKNLDNYKGDIKALLRDIAEPVLAKNREFLKKYVVDPYNPTRKKLGTVDGLHYALEIIYTYKRDAIYNGIARYVHDSVGAMDIVVKNKKNLSWKLSHDNTLNKETQEQVSNAIIQARSNLLLVTQASINELVARVTHYMPEIALRNDARAIQEFIQKVTDPAIAREQTGMRNALIQTLNKNIGMFIKKLIDKGIVKKL